MKRFSFLMISMGLMMVLGGCATTSGDRGVEERGRSEQVVQHDAVVRGFVGPTGEVAISPEALSELERLCADGLAVACTNLGYLLASGIGLVQDHREALRLFGEVCGDPRERTWEADRSWDLVLSADFTEEVACSHWAVLARGLFEERVISSFQAEEAMLRGCYEEAREGGAGVGRLGLVADVDGSGGGGGLKIVEDTLGSEAVRACVREAMARHLDDGIDEALFEATWAVSFVAMPGAGEEPNDEVGCDPRVVQQAIYGHLAAIEACGEEHLASHANDAGVVAARWEFGRTGAARGLRMASTVESTEVLQCLGAVIERIAIEPYPAGGCPVALPIQISSGEELHFRVMAR